MFANPFRWWNVLVFVVMIAVHILAAEFAAASDAISLIAIPSESWITPERYTLYIWGLIYGLLFFFVIYQLRRSTRSKDSIRRIGGLFCVSGLSWIAWVILWHFEWFVWAFVAFVIMFMMTFALYVKSRQSYEQKTVGERLFVYWPFSVLLSWLVFVLFMYVSNMFERYEWSRFGFSTEVWAIIFVIIAGLMAIVIGFKYRDAIYMLVFTWSMIGIAVYWNETSQLIWITAAIAGLMILLLMFVMLIRSRVNRQPRLRFK